MNLSKNTIIIILLFCIILIIFYYKKSEFFNPDMLQKDSTITNSSHIFKNKINQQIYYKSSNNDLSTQIKSDMTYIS